MISVTQFAETLRQILEEEANQLAKETGFIQRERTITGADFAQTLIFGWLEEPEITLDGLTQIAQRREVEITASGWHQRFTPEAVTFVERLLERLTQVRLEAEAAPVTLLKRFTAVIVEDSSTISLPDEVAELWRGCGGSTGSSQAALKLFVRWNVLTGELQGPLLTAGRHADGKSPFNEYEVKAWRLVPGRSGLLRALAPAAVVPASRRTQAVLPPTPAGGDPTLHANGTSTRVAGHRATAGGRSRGTGGAGGQAGTGTSTPHPATSTQGSSRAATQAHPGRGARS